MRRRRCFAPRALPLEPPRLFHPASHARVPGKPSPLDCPAGSHSAADATTASRESELDSRRG
eukprot:2103310-Rhodomonas_salina.2